MAFYQSIAPYYDHIFPFSPPQLEFIKNSAGDKLSERTVLDIGCGTGNLTIGISKHFNHVTGIDLDEEMLELAIKKSEGSSNIRFDKLNMLEIGSKYSQLFDSVLSFGNTLVHLKNAGEISDFLKQTKALLKPGGKLLLQIINYDNILDNKLSGLPPIENEHIRFERYYDYPENRNSIEFRTVLTVKKNNSVINNSVDLYPVRKTELEELILKVGYNNISFFGSFKRDKLKEESIPLVVEVW